MSLPQEPLGIRRRSSSLLVRYAYRHSHSTTLHDRFSDRFTAEVDATLPISPNRQTDAASALCFSPDTSSAHDHSTSELLRTLSSVAASKLPSFLSCHSHILCH